MGTGADRRLGKSVRCAWVIQGSVIGGLQVQGFKLGPSLRLPSPAGWAPGVATARVRGRREDGPGLPRPGAVLAEAPGAGRPASAFSTLPPKPLDSCCTVYTIGPNLTDRLSALGDNSSASHAASGVDPPIGVRRRRMGSARLF